MKKTGIAFLAGAMVIGSAAAGLAGPNVGGTNFGPLAREVTRNRIERQEKVYAVAGRPQLISNYEWVAKPRPIDYRTPTTIMMTRVPANQR